jgi:hypothetical protein
MSPIVERRMFWFLVVFAIAIRLALIATTYGTNDAGFMAVSVDLVNRVGIARSYAHTAMMNHPPLSFAYMKVISGVAAASGIAFVDVFRFFQVLADIVAAVALFHIGRQFSVDYGRALALFLLLSPGAAFISAFHCNTDATMVALILVAVALVAWRRYAFGGASLALACAIKIVPFLTVPIFLTFVPRRNQVAFIAAFAAVAAAAFLPAIIIGGPVVARVVFGYRGGLPYEWGIPGVAYALSKNVAAMRETGRAVMMFWQQYGSYFVYAGIAAVLVFVFRHRPSTPPALLHAIEIMFMTVLALAPGFGVQYIGWLIAFLPFAFSWRGSIALNAAISAFLFVTYTVWSGGWPWWYADMTHPGPWRWVGAVAGYVMWLIVCGALVVAILRFTRGSRSQTAH